MLKTIKYFSPKPNLAIPRLVTIGLSHYSEKARWVLDLSSLNYYEEAHCPAFHMATTLLELSSMPRISTWKKDSLFGNALMSRHEPHALKRKEKTGVPKLVLPKSFFLKSHILEPKDTGGENAVVANGSSGIIKFISDIFPNELGNMYPNGEKEELVVSLESKLDQELGNAATTWTFGNMLLTGESFYPAEKNMSSIWQSENNSSNTQRHDTDRLLEQKKEELLSRITTHRSQATSHSTHLNRKSIDVMIASISKQDINYMDKLLFAYLGKYFVPLVIKHNNISSLLKYNALKTIHEIFITMDNLLVQNNPELNIEKHFFLGTEHITAVEITFVSLSLPLLMPTKAKSLFASMDVLQQAVSRGEGEHIGCKEMIELSLELRRVYKCAQYAIALYDRYRPVNSVTNDVQFRKDLSL